MMCSILVGQGDSMGEGPKIEHFLSHYRVRVLVPGLKHRNVCHLLAHLLGGLSSKVHAQCVF